MGAGRRGGPGRARHPMGMWGMRWRRDRHRPGRGKEGPGPAPFRATPLPAHVLGTGSRRSPPAAQECACAAFVSAGADGHLPARGAALEPCWARRARRVCTADRQYCILERHSVETLELGDL